MKDLNLGAFKAYDIRTKVERLDDELRQRLYDAVCLYMKETLSVDSIVICHDARLYVSQMAEELSLEFIKNGINVYLNPQPISTCQFYHSLMKRRHCAGIMLTASHNPGNYVGMKILGPDLVPIACGYGKAGGLKKIKENYEQGLSCQKSSVRGKRWIIEDLESYIDYSMNLAGIKHNSLKGERILIECLSGSSGTELSLAFQEAGADLELRNIVPNGFFPSGDPNPIIETSIAPAREIMRKGSFDFGFCLDGDGDRLDLMNSKGNQIAPGFNMSILISEINKIFSSYLNGRQAQYYADVKAFPSAIMDMSQNDVGVHIIRNGHSFIKAKLNENFLNGYLAAEEESAHYYMNFPYDINDVSKGVASVESTLFFSLLTAKCFHQHPEKYHLAEEHGSMLFREREWSLHCEKYPKIIDGLLLDVESEMVKRGAKVIKTMDDGSDLDATLMRFNLPISFDKNSRLGNNWIQVAQRISRSEDAMVRWEVVSNTKEGCSEMNSVIKSITEVYVCKEMASY